MTELASVNEDGKIVEDGQTIVPEIAPVKGEQMVPKARLDQVIQQKKEAIATLTKVAGELIEDIPEEFRVLVPALDPAGQISWIRQAQKSGIFTQKVADGLDTERPSGQKKVDTSDMKPMQMMALGYKK